MTVLGVDFGSKRIGLALASVEGRLPKSLGIIAPSGTLKKDAAVLFAKAKDVGAEVIALGLPINDGYEDQKMSRVCQLIAGHLKDLGARVELIDESGSSLEAEELLRERNSKGSVDAEAACIILDRFLANYGK